MVWELLVGRGLDVMLARLVLVGMKLIPRKMVCAGLWSVMKEDRGVVVEGTLEVVEAVEEDALG